MLIKSIKKIMIQILVITFVLALLNKSSMAASFKFNAVANKEEVAPGEEVEITFNIKDIDLGEDGINTIEGKIEYDHNVFEEVKSTDITNLNNWVFTYNDEKTDLNGKFLGIILSSGVKEEQSIAKIKLKVKENQKDTATKISIKGITTNDGTNLILDEDKTISISIKQKTEDKNKVPNENQEDNTEYKGDKLPQTGIRNLYIVSGVIVIIVAGITSFIKYKNVRHK